MTEPREWFRVDNQLPEHPKVAPAGPLAGWLHICGIAYASRMLTDGYLPRAIVARLVDWSEVFVDTARAGDLAGTIAHPDSLELAERLVDSGLWEVADGGWLIHDYLGWQSSRAEVIAKRVDVERFRRAGRASAAARAERRAQQNLNDVPTRKETSLPTTPKQRSQQRSQQNLNDVPTVDVDVDVEKKSFAYASERADATPDEPAASQAKPTTRVIKTKNPDGSTSSTKVRVPDGLVVARMSPGTGWMWQAGYSREDFELP